MVVFPNVLSKVVRHLEVISEAWFFKVLSIEIKTRFVKLLLGLPAPKLTHKNKIFKTVFGTVSSFTNIATSLAA